MKKALNKKRLIFTISILCILMFFGLSSLIFVVPVPCSELIVAYTLSPRLDLITVDIETVDGRPITLMSKRTSLDGEYKAAVLEPYTPLISFSRHVFSSRSKSISLSGLNAVQIKDQVEGDREVWTDAMTLPYLSHYVQDEERARGYLSRSADIELLFSLFERLDAIPDVQRPALADADEFIQILLDDEAAYLIRVLDKYYCLYPQSFYSISQEDFLLVLSML